MKNFKDYDGKQKNPVPDAVNTAQRIAEENKGKSEGEVIDKIIAEAERGRRAGTLTDSDIDAFYRGFAPSLNSFQRKKLSQIIEKLKKIPLSSK